MNTMRGLLLLWMSYKPARSNGLFRALSLVGLFSLAAALRGQTQSEPLLLLGAGRPGGFWDTEYVLSNGGNLQMQGFIAPGTRIPNPCFPFDLCLNQIRGFQIPPRGTVVTIGPNEGFGAMYVGAINNLEPLTVRARVKHLMNPALYVEVPAVRLSRVLALDPSKLVFTGATRTANSRSNLVLTNLLVPTDADNPRVELLVEAYSEDGQLLGARTISIRGRQTPYIVDVLDYLGVAQLQRGQVRVTKAGGVGVIWGIMFSLNTDGTLSAALGAHP